MNSSCFEKAIEKLRKWVDMKFIEHDNKLLQWKNICEKDALINYALI